MKIDLQPFTNPSSSVFTGRPQGVQARGKLNLSGLDKTEERIYLIIPENTTSFNPSFFLGLLFESIQRLGIDRFREKYNLVISAKDPTLHEVIDSNLKDGFRNAINSINNKTGLNTGMSA